jgi:hypothetical protein
MVASKQMKRFLPTTLALLLVMGSLGHVFAAAFCPRMSARDCCLTKTANSQRLSQPHQHMHGMAMDGMANESMPMDDSNTEDMVMDDADLPASTTASDDLTVLAGVEESVPANRLELPADTCTHCLSHSGAQNAPVSSLSVADQSNKNFGSVPLPVSRFLTRSVTTLAPIGLPREHAPPGKSAPRHILLNVFLI